MVVCETGTGSGAMSHAILRTIAPFGKLHTFEFNKQRADQARQEFAKNGLSHLVNVYHKDVCGKAPVTPAEGSNGRSKANDNEPATHEGGFGLEGQSVEAIFLDLPEPWLAIPHAAFCLKPNGRIASYSPCIEQTQQTCIASKYYYSILFIFVSFIFLFPLANYSASFLSQCKRQAFIPLGQWNFAYVKTMSMTQNWNHHPKKNDNERKRTIQLFCNRLLAKQP